MNELQVWLVDPARGAASLIGTLRRRQSRSGETVSFAYEPAWLAGHEPPLHFQLDPDLPLTASDHLRNQGFLRQGNGWRLAPAFDVNPNPDRQFHVLALDETDPTPDSPLLKKTAAYYRLTRKRAEAISEEVRHAVDGWHAAAETLRIPANQIATLTAIIDPER